MSPGDSHLLLSVATPLQEERAGWRLFHEEIHKKTVGSWIMKIPLVSHTIHANSIFLCIHHKHQPNVGKYIINGSYGNMDYIVFNGFRFSWCFWWLQFFGMVFVTCPLSYGSGGQSFSMEIHMCQLLLLPYGHAVAIQHQSIQPLWDFNRSCFLQTTSSVKNRTDLTNMTFRKTSVPLVFGNLLESDFNIRGFEDH